jgi:hypothetical protein
MDVLHRYEQVFSHFLKDPRTPPARIVKRLYYWSHNLLPKSSIGSVVGFEDDPDIGPEIKAAESRKQGVLILHDLMDESVREILPDDLKADREQAALYLSNGLKKLIDGEMEETSAKDAKRFFGDVLERIRARLEEGVQNEADHTETTS